MRITSISCSAIRRHILLAVCACILVSLFSCNSTKKLHTGEYLLNHNRIIYRFGAAQKNKGITTNITDIGKEGIEKFEIPQRIQASEILPYIKQKPNTRIFFILRFYLYLYDLPDSVNTARAKARRDSDYVVKARKKGWSNEKLKRKTDRLTGRQWIMEQGEPPAILDSSLTQKSTEQIKAFLFNKGYFNSDVKDSVRYKSRKAEVFYIIKPGKVYKIHRINYQFEDPELATTIYADTADCKIRRNLPYDKDILDAESDRITKELNNSGYYYFSKNYVSYLLDTNSTTRNIDITINIKKFVKRSPVNKDSTIETNHTIYHIRHVIVQMDYNPARVAFYHPTDSIAYNGLQIVYPRGGQCLKPFILKTKIRINPGDLYRAEDEQNTYTGLTQLNEFSYISIKYAPVKDSNYVDCYIQLNPLVKHNVGAEIELTNTGGDAGVQGDINYENYNQFNGAERLTFKINGGLIAQQSFTSKTGNFLFNTADLGPELDLSIPRASFPFNIIPYNSIRNPQSFIKLSFDYEERPDYYLRHILGLSFTPVDFYSLNKKSHFTIALFEWNLVNANLTQGFNQQLEQYNLFFQNSFKNQVITDFRFSWTFTTQDPSKRQNHFDYLKFDVEPSGLLLAATKNLLHLPEDTSGVYYIRQFNAPFSQYLKLDGEWRHYFILGKAQKQQIATRILAGVGLPYDNSSEMPYTKSFWVGGSNDIRAWQFQTLGPGGSPKSNVAGQVGETKLEGNAEYRVKLVKYFDFAWFVDAGNIWLIKSVANENIPRAYMQLSGPNSFLSEMAIGTGPGFRFDFDYFVFRVDLGFPVKDPSQPAGQRWVSLNQSVQRIVLNIGVGFPF